MVTWEPFRTLASGTELVTFRALAAGIQVLPVLKLGGVKQGATVACHRNHRPKGHVFLLAGILLRRTQDLGGPPTAKFHKRSRYR